MPASIHKGASLVLTPHIQAGGYQTQATVSVYTSASIDHLTIKLFDGSKEIASKTIPQGDLAKPITFSNLRANTTYTVKSYAYLANNAQISLDGGSSRTFTTLTDDRPNILSLPVLLSDLPFNGIGSSSIQVANGGYSYAHQEGLGLLLRGSVKANVCGSYDYLKARLFQVSTGTEVASLQTSSLNPTFTFNELPENSSYNAWVEAYRSDALIASQSVVLNLGNDNVIATLALSLPYIVPTVVSTLAGVAGSPGSDNGASNTATFNIPASIAIDPSGNVYIADYGNHLIRRIDAQTKNVSTLAGVAGTPGTTNGIGTSAKFYHPFALAFDAAGNLYVSDHFNHLIRKIDAQSNYVSTLAGVAGSPGNTNGASNVAEFSNPAGIALDNAGNVYVADSSNHLIRKIDAQSNSVSTLAGVAGSPGSDNGASNVAKFNGPVGITLDAAGNLYVADAFNHLIRKIDAQSNSVSTLAGVAGSPGSDNGIGTSAKFNSPYGIAMDSAGNAYVADYQSHLVRRIDAQSNYVSILAGSAGSTGTTNGMGNVAKFNGPAGVAVDSAGNVYVSDCTNNLIRLIK